jgi:hypothetical protein
MFVTFVWSSLNPCGDNVSADEGHWYLTFYVALFLIHSIWEQVPNTPHPQVVSIATPAQEKMKLWKETTRSSKIMMSSRRGLAATPSRLPVKAACIYISFPHFDYCKDYVDVSDIWCNLLSFPFYIVIWALCDDVQLCNCCVRELLILARTWFAFGLPSKTGCDTTPPGDPSRPLASPGATV